MSKSLTRIGLTIAGLGISMGLSHVLVRPAYAGTFSREIWANNQKIGYLNFSWEDSKVDNGRVKHFSALNSFSYTDVLSNTYELPFALSTTFQSFEYNTLSHDFKIVAYNYDPTAPSLRNGVVFQYNATNSLTAPISGLLTHHSPTGNIAYPSLRRNSTSDYFHTFELRNVPTSPNDNPTDPPDDPDGQQIPESSPVVGLLVFGGVVFATVRKR